MPFGTKSVSSNSLYRQVAQRLEAARQMAGEGEEERSCPDVHRKPQEERRHTFDQLDRRIRRMEDRVTNREYDWERQLWTGE